MTDQFSICGTEVHEQALLQLQFLAADLQRLKSGQIRSRQLGEQRSVFRGQGREFAEMKSYQPGDDVRQIDWHVTARKQAPFVRVMEEDRHIEHQVILNLTTSLFFGTRQCLKSVTACYWAAFLLWRLSALKHPVTLEIYLFGERWQQRRLIRSAQTAAACALICNAHRELQSRYQQATQITPTIQPHSGQPNLWLLGDWIETGQLNVFSQMFSGKMNSLSVLQVLDAFDENLPKAGRLPVKQQQDSGWIDTESERSLQRYRARFQHAQTRLNELVTNLGGQLFSHRNDQFTWQEVAQWPLYH